MGLNEGNLKHIWFEDVYFKDGYSCARSSGALGFVTARGVQVREARRRAYRTVRDLGIPYPLYRTDVGSRASWEYPLLEEWGWIKHT
jgi:phosphoribosylamine-glycine ligase